jgi:hypothetical protein
MNNHERSATHYPAVFVLLLACTLLPGVVPRPAAAQANCQFVLGFANIRQLIGASIVGNCLENESFNQANGNAEQRTTGGMLVWRKSDNWTAFTNGFETWVNGPQGLQKRLNTQRFAWENDPAPGTTQVPSGGPQLASFAGTWRSELANSSSPRIDIRVSGSRVFATQWHTACFGQSTPTACNFGEVEATVDRTDPSTLIVPFPLPGTLEPSRVTLLSDGRLRYRSPNGFTETYRKG